MTKSGPFWEVCQQLKRGEITRREFVERCQLIGVRMPVALFVAHAVEQANEKASRAAQEATE